MKILKVLFNLFLNLRYGKNNLKTESELLKDGMKFAESMQRVERPEEGGIFTYQDYGKYPYPGFITPDDLEEMSVRKRIIPFALEITRKLLSKYIPKDPKEYSRPVREIYRVMSLAVERHKCTAPRDTFRNIRDIVCVLLERDDAYRPVAQDILPELDLEKIKMDEAEKWWFCAKPYYFGGKEQEEYWKRIQNERFEYEVAESQKTEEKLQEKSEKSLDMGQRVENIAKEIKPDLEALLKKHGINPDFNNPGEEQVDIKIRIKIPK